jgi:predicted TIM-barrel fold metal-dependent hydrolase
MMNVAGIDASVLTSGAGMCADLERSRFINNKTKQAERDYPGRFIGAAHVHPLGGSESLKELARCARELGFPGVVITSETNGLFLDAPEFDPFWAEVSRLGMYVFVHPALQLNFSQQFNADDMARSVGREFSLIMATIRLINCGVLDRYPNLTILMSHLSGGIAGVLGRIRKYQDKAFWGTTGNPKHGRKPEKDFDYYLEHRFAFDTGGFSGAMSSVKAALLELPESRMVFATDYPQEIRSSQEVRQFVQQIRSLGPTGERILSGNAALLIKEKVRQTAG